MLSLLKLIHNPKALSCLLYDYVKPAVLMCDFFSTLHVEEFEVMGLSAHDKIIVLILSTHC